MNPLLLASEGGYQAFELKGGEFAVLALSGAAALLALAVGFILVKGTLAADQGTPKMIEIATAIQEGALAYLKRQFRTIGFILIPLTIVVFLTSTEVVKPESMGGGVALSFFESGMFRTLAFLAGAIMSGLTGYIGMTLATRGNVRTAAAALSGSLPRALEVAFRTGGIAGMFTVGLGLLGATLIIAVFQNTSSAILVGFGFGGSLLALFLRVGGGIFTKAADVGADLVGKVEAGIPEDDPRNPATIADNVGDNVGDCAGMAADLFESYEVTLVASIILGVAAFESIGANPALGLMFPVAARAIGVIASIVGVYAVKAKEGETNALKPINRGFLTAGILTVIGTGIVAFTYVGDKGPGGGHEGMKVFLAVVAGLVLAQVVSRLTEYFTGTEYAPVQEIAESARTGPATTVLSGTASGLESSVYSVIAIAIALGMAIALGDGNLQFSLYLVALCGMGMLATTGVVVSEDTFGPVADNAAGIAEMSGEFHGEAERIMVSLDAVGNTTKAVTKGFAIGSAVIAAVALFASFIEGAGKEILRDRQGRRAAPGAAGRVRRPAHQRGRPEGLHRPADRRCGAVPLLGPGHPGRGPHGRRGRPGGPPPVRRRQDHGRHQAPRLRPGHRHLHGRLAPGAGHPGPAGHPDPGHHRLRHQLAGARRLPGRRHPHRPAHGRLPVELRRGVGQRQEVHRGRARGRQGLRGPQGGRHRRHRRRPVQGHRRPGAEPADQGDEPDLAAHPPGRHQPGGRRPALRYAIAGVALVVLIGAVAFSKRSAEAMDAGVDGPAGAAAPATVADGDSPKKLASDALDRWIMDLGDEDAALRAQFRDAKSQLK